MRVLILGGTAEARALAQALHARPGCAVVTSLAGRTSEPALPDGELRVGGLGGADGLAEQLRTEAVDALVDATHPFAEVISRHAVQAAAATGTRLVVLRRTPWAPQQGDRWTRVRSVAAAAREVAATAEGGCVFITTGRRDLAAFAADDRHDYLIRTVEPPDGPLPPRHTLVRDRGPYTVDGELALLTRHAVTVLVTKNSGGPLTEAKLTAARRRGLPVVMVDPPEPPAPADHVAEARTVDEAVRLLTGP